MKRGIGLLIALLSLLSLPLAFSSLATNCYVDNDATNGAYRQDCSTTDGCGSFNSCGKFCGQNIPVTNSCGNDCSNADLNMDGQVEVQDIGTLGSFPTGSRAEGSSAIADLDMNGVIDIFDMATMNGCFGKTVTGSSLKRGVTYNHDGAGAVVTSTWDQAICHPNQCVYLYTCYNEGATHPARLGSCTSSSGPNEWDGCDTICNEGKWTYCRSNNDVRGFPGSTPQYWNAPGQNVQGKRCVYGGQWRDVLRGSPYVGDPNLPCAEGYCPASVDGIPYRCSTQTPDKIKTSDVGVCCPVGTYWRVDPIIGNHCVQYEDEPPCTSTCDKSVLDIIRSDSKIQLQCIKQALHTFGLYRMCRKVTWGEGGAQNFAYRPATPINIIPKQ
ncbi:hypothetical protein HY491_00590 [Candidatus Woesearchaeota archaeon]|nr:hypothetical protein [Candidatus Woesearchaeota archaeon]